MVAVLEPCGVLDRIEVTSSCDGGSVQWVNTTDCDVKTHHQYRFTWFIPLATQ